MYNTSTDLVLLLTGNMYLIKCRISVEVKKILILIKIICIFSFGKICANFSYHCLGYILSEKHIDLL